ncbi:hypothetical protein PO909_025404 [Leuciscus waleckii]
MMKMINGEGRWQIGMKNEDEYLRLVDQIVAGEAWFSEVCDERESGETSGVIGVGRPYKSQTGTSDRGERAEDSWDRGKRTLNEEYKRCRVFELWNEI